MLIYYKLHQFADLQSVQKTKTMSEKLTPPKKAIYSEYEWDDLIAQAHSITSQAELDTLRHQAGNGNRSVLVDWVERQVSELQSPNITHTTPTHDIADRPSLLDTTDAHEGQSDEKYAIFANPYERMKYVSLTDKIIAEMDGTKGPKPDYALYLDKSARPVSWLVREFWDDFAQKNEDGTTPSRPQSLFVDIDGRKDMSDSLDSISSLRALFAKEVPQDSADIMQTPTFLDGANVLIVDEIKVSGETLTRAAELLKKAYPEAHFSTTSFLDGSPKGPGMPETDNPRWYERHSDRYRAVIDRNSPALSEEWHQTQLQQSNDQTIRGQRWLARIPEAQSKDVLQLRSEIHQMALDVKAGTLPYTPDGHEDRTEAVAKELSGLGVDEYYEFMHWAKNHYYAKGPLLSNEQTIKAGPIDDKTARTYITHAQGTVTPQEALPEVLDYAERLGLVTKAGRDMARFVLTAKIRE